jgi:hypothetical protein
MGWNSLKPNFDAIAFLADVGQQGLHFRHCVLITLFASGSNAGCKDLFSFIGPRLAGQ